MEIDDLVVAININRHYEDSKNNAKKLYDCTRSLWRLKRERANKAQYQQFSVWKNRTLMKRI